MLAIVAQLQEVAFTLGRSPADSVIYMTTGSFFSQDTYDVVLVHLIGDANVRYLDKPKELFKVPVYRLWLMRQTDKGFFPYWRSELLIGQTAIKANLTPDVWAVGDFDLDSLAELLILSGDSGRLFHFNGESLKIDRFVFKYGPVYDAVSADMDNDGYQELVMLKQIRDSSGINDVIQVFQFAGTDLHSRGKPVLLPVESTALQYALLGSARLEDYPGTPVIVAAEYSELRPSRYYVFYPVASDSFVVTGQPFPYQDRFSKEETLCAGRLRLFNVGDTLVGLGYFVPGAGSESNLSYAALQDGEWRILRLKDWRKNLVNNVCRVKNGWLELRRGNFFLYYGEPFYWR